MLTSAAFVGIDQLNKPESLLIVTVRLDIRNTMMNFALLNIEMP